MSEYKRLTSGNFDGQCEYYDYYIDGCRIGDFILKCQECPHKERYDRLKEFEDKKESGQLVELPYNQERAISLYRPRNISEEARICLECPLPSCKKRDCAGYKEEKKKLRRKK